MKQSLLSTALSCSISSGDALETEHNPPQSPYIVPALDEDSDLPLDAREPSQRNEHTSEHLADALTFDLNFFDLDYIMTTRSAAFPDLVFVASLMISICFMTNHYRPVLSMTF